MVPVIDLTSMSSGGANNGMLMLVRIESGTEPMFRCLPKKELEPILKSPVNVFGNPSAPLEILEIREGWVRRPK